MKHPYHRNVWIFPSLALLIVFLTACGGSSPTGVGGSPPPSEWFKQTLVPAKCGTGVKPVQWIQAGLTNGNLFYVELKPDEELVVIQAADHDDIDQDLTHYTVRVYHYVKGKTLNNNNTGSDFIEDLVVVVITKADSCQP
jgi:LPS sulfotransferase NodH